MKNPVKILLRSYADFYHKSGWADWDMKRSEKEEEWRNEHPVANIAKQLAKGTIKGLVGNAWSNHHK